MKIKNMLWKTEIKFKRVSLYFKLCDIIILYWYFVSNHIMSVKKDQSARWRTNYLLDTLLYNTVRVIYDDILDYYIIIG